MISKSKLKYYSSLAKKKYRDTENKFLVEGHKLIFEALISGYECELILMLKDVEGEIHDLIKPFLSKIKQIEIITEKEIKKIQSTVHSQGSIAVFKKNYPPKVNQIRDRLIVALENVNDPGNVGTIIRNADWFGVKDLLLSDNSADIYNPKTIRASAGSVFHLDIIYRINLLYTIAHLKTKGYKILCADVAGTNIYNYSKSAKEIIVFSNEANGPTDKLLEIADERITVPKKGKAESLNVASASAIILSELTRY